MSRYVVTIICPRCGRAFVKEFSITGTRTVSCPTGHSVRVRVTR